MTFDGVLILSHCGFSFAEDLIAAIRARDLQPFVLSSKPLAEHSENRLQMLRESAEAVLSSDSHVLDEDDVAHAHASLRASGYTVKACISVWEGYRVLMAHANALLGVSDLAAQRADSLRNKLFVRNELRRAGLSGIDARLVTPDGLDESKRDGVAYFIQPVQGIASCGAFRWSQDTTWSALDAIARRAQEDTIYSSALGNHVKFLAENYVAGTEFSFEVLVAERQAFEALSPAGDAVGVMAGRLAANILRKKSQTGLALSSSQAHNPACLTGPLSRPTHPRPRAACRILTISQTTPPSSRA